MIILQKSANREIRIGWQNIAIAPKKLSDKFPEKNTEKLASASHELYSAKRALCTGAVIDFLPSGKYEVSEFGIEEYEKRSKSPLDIISEFQCSAQKRKIRGGWGHPARPTSFTKKARHLILEAGAIMDRDCGKNVFEITLTLPGSTEGAMRAIALWSGWLCNRLTQVVRNSDKSAHWFYVWELQKRGALHLHFALGCSTFAEAESLARRIESKWFDLLKEIGEKESEDLFARARGGSWKTRPDKWQSSCKPIRKSLAAYFSKYCSKPATKPGFGGVFARSVPARFWGCASHTRSAAIAERIEVRIDAPPHVCADMIGCLREFCDTPGRVKSYTYAFDLGVSACGTPLGGGWREVNYYESAEFVRICSWLPLFIEYLQSCANSGWRDWGEYDQTISPPSPCANLSAAQG